MVYTFAAGAAGVAGVAGVGVELREGVVEADGMAVEAARGLV